MTSAVLYAIERGQQIVTDMGITAGGQAMAPPCIDGLYLESL